MTGTAKEIVILGGPNGAGKTTAASVLLPKKLYMGEFVNADEIARNISPANPESAAIQAGRTMLLRMNDLLEQGRSFAFETTCSGQGHLTFLKRAKNQGWRITLIFLWLPSPQAARDRVALRVRWGGHDIPPALVERRFGRGLTNLRQGYLPLSDIAAIYDNSAGERRIVASKTVEGGLVVHDLDIWTRIQGREG